MSDKPTPMTPADAARIQGHADRTGTNQDFKGRAQSGAANNVNSGRVSGAGGGGGGNRGGSGGGGGGGNRGGSGKGR